MSKLVTVARPYAKAAFDFALEHEKVVHWQSMLEFSVEIIRNERIAEMLSGAFSPKKISETFITICGDNLDAFGQNLIRVMVENGRLVILPEVLEQFVLFRASQEGTVEVNVISAIPLKEKQLARISNAIEKRLLSKVKLNCKLDKSVLAGVVIRVGDMVIDGSVRARLERLADILHY